MQRRELEEYIKALMEHHQQIQKDFPVMHEYIISFLIRIEEENSQKYSKSTFKIDRKLHECLKSEVLIPKREYLNKHTPIKYFLREIRVNPFLDLICLRINTNINFSYYQQLKNFLLN